MAHRDTYEMIAAKAAQIGFVQVGVIPTDQCENGYKRLQRARDVKRDPPFTPSCLNLRTTPKLYAPWASSMIIGLYPYGAPPVQTPPKPVDGFLRGRLARIAWGKDYHNVVRQALNGLGTQLRDAGLLDKFESFVDTSPFSERELALRAGLGIRGQHNNLLSPTGTPFVIIGGLLVDQDLGTWKGVSRSKAFNCRNCLQCITVCPGKALSANDFLDYSNCVAYLTVQKGIIPRDKRPIMKDYLYGCDLCLEACSRHPLPDTLKVAETTEYPTWGGEALTVEHLYPKLKSILSLTNKQFKVQWRDSALNWRGKTVLQRNAMIALGNSGDGRGIDLAVAHLKDDREIMKAHAVWACERLYNDLSRFQKRRVLRALDLLANQETSEMVQQELKVTLDSLGHF